MTTYEKLVLPHRALLLRSARKWTGSADGAEDLVQDTLVAALKGWHRFDVTTNAKAWLFSVMRCVFLDGCVKRARLARADAEAMRDDVAPAADPLSGELAEALETLSPDKAEQLIRYAVVGQTIPQIAVEMGVPVGTVLSRSLRIRRTLSAKLRAYAELEDRR